jgi:hypothetical protein
LPEIFGRRFGDSIGLRDYHDNNDLRNRRIVMLRRRILLD